MPRRPSQSFLAIHSPRPCALGAKWSTSATQGMYLCSAGCATMNERYITSSFTYTLYGWNCGLHHFITHLEYIVSFVIQSFYGWKSHHV